MGNIKSCFSYGFPKALLLILIKGKKTDNVSLFPPEIIIEILSWLPVEFHGRLMLVCKQWYALIQDRHFMEMNMCRFEIDYVTYYEGEVLNDSESDSDNDGGSDNDSENSMLANYAPVYACDGLYLQKNIVTNMYRIRNPIIKQVLELPDPHKDSHGIIFSYVPATSNYKCVSIYDDESSTECCEVFSVENDEFSWRPLNMPTRDCPNRKREKISLVSTGDAVHCVRVIASGAVMVEEVVSLDLETEQFTVTTFPRGQYKIWEKVWPLNFMGKLALVDRMEADLFCVLVLEDYKKQKWGKRKPLIPSASVEILEDEHGTIIPYSFDPPEMLWFWVKDKMFISYNVRTGKEEKREPQVLQQGYKIFGLHPWLCSLVRLKGMQLEDKTPTQPPPLESMQPEEREPTQPPPQSDRVGLQFNQKKILHYFFYFCLSVFISSLIAPSL